MCPNHHAEYDAGLITIDMEQNVTICAYQDDEWNYRPLAGRVSHIKPGYFDYHNKQIFVGDFNQQ
jgi:hypothetical protein